MVTVLFFTMLIGGNVFADPGDNSNFITNQNNALENNKILHENMKKNSELDENFAGAYIDEDGNLNVNYVGDIEKVKNTLKLNNVNFHSAKYSYKHLEDITNKLSDKMIELGIKSVELDDRNNKVIITLDKFDKEKENRIKKEIDSPAMDIIEDSHVGSAQFTVNVTNGAQAITAGGQGSTVGCAAKTTSGVAGFLIPGHITAIAGDCSVGGNVVGTVDHGQFGGKIDATFVKCNTGYTPCENFTNGDSYIAATVDTSQYGLVVGLSVYGYGSKSGKQPGKVLSTNYSEVVDGTPMTNMVKCDYKAVHGDSGAGVAYYRYKGSASYEYDVMGLQSFSKLATDGSWIPGTSYSAFSRIDYIFSALGLQNY
jgi:streptogrisin B